MKKLPLLGVAALSILMLAACSTKSTDAAKTTETTTEVATVAETTTTTTEETSTYESPVRIIGQYFDVDSDEYIKQSDNVFLEKGRDFVEYTLDQASNVERVKVNFDLFALDEELDADLINGHIFDYLPKDSEEVSSSETLERNFKSSETGFTYKVVYAANDQGITALEITKK